MNGGYSLITRAGENQNGSGGTSQHKMMVNIYGHLVPGDNKEAVDKLDDNYESASNRTLYAPKIKTDSNKFA